MKYFSSFWKNHYNDIGSCCITHPLDEQVPWTDGTRVADYIDTKWMNEERMKWIGWDKQGYVAWITPDGMIHRFNDLKRNEKGKKYEREVEKLELYGDGNGFPEGSPRGRDLYEWELEVQKNCGFCPKASGSKGDGKDAEEKEDKEGGGGGGGEKEKESTDWEELASGKIADYSKVLDQSMVTDTSDVTNTGNIAPTDIEGENYGQHWMPDDDEENPYIAPVPYLPPVVMPTPKTEFRNPVLDTSNILDTSKVATPVVNHFQQKMAERQKAFEDQFLRNLKPVPIDNLRVKEPTRPKTPTFDSQFPNAFDEQIIRNLKPDTIDKLRVKSVLKRDGKYTFPDKPVHLENYEEYLNKQKQKPKTNYNTNSTEELARQLLNSSNVELSKGHLSQQKDSASAYNNILNTADGNKSKLSQYDNAPGGEVSVSPKLLSALVELSKKYQFRVEEITGASHSRGSKHYVGHAVDINIINRLSASANNPYLNQFANDARILGATKIIKAPSSGHKTHIHLEF